MHSFYAVFKRELKSYFTTPVAYVFLIVFLFFSGYLTFKQGFYEIRQADMLDVLYEYATAVCLHGTGNIHAPLV